MFESSLHDLLYEACQAYGFAVAMKCLRAIRFTRCIQEPWHLLREHSQLLGAFSFAYQHVLRT